MKYKARSGIILTEICGEYLLIADEQARKDGPAIVSINETAAFMWKQLVHGSALKDLLQAASDEYEIDDMNEAEKAIRTQLKEMIGLRLITEE